MQQFKLIFGLPVPKTFKSLTVCFRTQRNLRFSKDIFWSKKQAEAKPKHSVQLKKILFTDEYNLAHKRSIKGKPTQSEGISWLSWDDGNAEKHKMIQRISFICYFLV